MAANGRHFLRPLAGGRFALSSPCSRSLGSTGAGPWGRNLRLRPPIQLSAHRSNNGESFGAEAAERHGIVLGDGPFERRGSFGRISDPGCVTMWDQVWDRAEGALLPH
jgi:hypothetical protein